MEVLLSCVLSCIGNFQAVDLEALEISQRLFHHHAVLLHHIHHHVTATHHSGDVILQGTAEEFRHAVLLFKDLGIAVFQLAREVALHILLTTVAVAALLGSASFLEIVRQDSPGVFGRFVDVLNCHLHLLICLGHKGLHLLVSLADVGLHVLIRLLDVGLQFLLCLHHESFHLFIRLLDEGAFGLASAIISALNFTNLCAEAVADLVCSLFDADLCRTNQFFNAVLEEALHLLVLQCGRHRHLNGVPQA
mmetsp:Transcript_22175/g.48706  ORF Transcript_22175/g.48706 Transcript_22175/m.48706 type:complete len:249 (-) Transcript_22175:1065-1811(-)